MHYGSDILIAAQPETVWAELSRFERAPTFVPLVTAVDASGATPLRTGSRLRLTIEYLGHEFDAHPRAEIVEPPTRLLLREVRPSLGVVVDVEWALRAEPGGTRLSMAASVMFESLFTQLAARSLVSDDAMRHAIGSSLDGFKDFVEAQSTAVRGIT